MQRATGDKDAEIDKLKSQLAKCRKDVDEQDEQQEEIKRELQF